ncbi:MAG: DNA polymerase III subunit delta [Candidatus Eremiobacteraeota bacterium]|nr:DNA polymerase III subunit delta [Candidatus Eremiobacteraeota bacterium]
MNTAGAALSFGQLLEGKEKKGSHLYYLEGADEFLLREAQRHLKARLLDPSLSDFNYSRIVGAKDVKAAAINALCQEFPLMSPLRVVALEEVQKMKEEETERLASYFADLPKTTVVILSFNTSAPQKGKNPLGKKLESLIRAKAVQVQCSMAEREAEEWIIAHLKRSGYEIRQDAALLLRKRIGNDLWLISEELNKLKAYCGNRKIISRTDIESISAYTPQAQMYHITDSIMRGNADGALKAFYELTATEEPSLGMMSYLFRFFMGVIDAQRLFQETGSAREVARIQRKSEYVVRKNLELASSITGSHVYKIADALLQADLSIKKGKDRRIVFEMLIIHLCGLFRKRERFSRDAE